MPNKSLKDKKVSWNISFEIRFIYYIFILKKRIFIAKMAFLLSK